MTQSWLKFVVLAICSGELGWSVALASDSRLMMPRLASENVELLLKEEFIQDDVSSVLQVFVGKLHLCCVGKSPIAGTYRVDGRTVIFDPAFDFIKGQSYTVLSRDMQHAIEIGRHLTEFSIQVKETVGRPEVVAIFPSAVEIPENTLRFYLHFSDPMKPHMSSRFIKLVDETGTSDPAAFMGFKQELWSEDRTRLTLLMDPGRIKRGVTQNRSLGPALRQGKIYSIVIEGGWPSAGGVRKTSRFEQSFTVSQPLRTLPDAARWEFQRPRIATHDPLVIEFDRSFDHQLAQAAISVLDEAGRIIQGTVSIENFEKTWRFQPLKAWSTATMLVVVDAGLEDVAGNNFRELLDHSVEAGIDSIDQKTITLALRPSPGKAPGMGSR